jgi:hypothetical protein
MPPELVGRDALIDNFRVLLARVDSGADEKGLLITGLRGVGKTVLLNSFREVAEGSGGVVVMTEVARKGAPFPARFAALCRRALYDISPKERWSTRATAAARAIRSFSLKVDPAGAVAFGVDVDAVAGTADSGDLVLDISDVVVALGNAAIDHGKTVVFLIDEIQYLKPEELGALVMAKHQINQRRLPIVFSGAGLPQLPSLTGEAQTYSERMFSFPEIGPLDPVDSALALTLPVVPFGVSFEDDAIDYIIACTGGYPFFIQEYGKAVWNEAGSTAITLNDARAAEHHVENVLDQDFFSVRTDVLPAAERAYVRALASLGPGLHTPGEIATAMGKKSSSSIGFAGNRLIERGLVYRSRRSWVGFTVPQFDRYVIRSQM